MSWKKIKLGDVLIQCGTRAKELKPDSKIPFFGVSNVEGITNTRSKPGEKKDNYILVEENCFAYNPYRINVGSIGLMPKGKMGLVSPAYVVFRTNENELSSELLIKFLKSSEGIKQIKRYARGTVRQALRFEDLCEIELRIPTIEEQKQLINQFYKFEQKNNIISTELDHQVELVTQLRQAILREAMQGKLVKQNPNDEPASELLKKIKAEKEKLLKEKKLKKGKSLSEIEADEILFAIPENWGWCSLGEICNNITKGSSPKWQGVKYTDTPENGILFITSKNVDSFKIDLSHVTYVEKKFNEIEPRSILRKGDLLTNIVGASIGRTALYDLDDIANINQAVCILRIEHSLVDKGFLLYIMNSDFVINLMLTSQFAPGRANLSMGSVANFPIPIPPLTEQHRIVEKLNQLMQLCDDLENSIQQSKTQTGLLLQSALRDALKAKDSIDGCMVM